MCMCVCVCVCVSRPTPKTSVLQPPSSLWTSPQLDRTPTWASPRRGTTALCQDVSLTHTHTHTHTHTYSLTVIGLVALVLHSEPSTHTHQSKHTVKPPHTHTNLNTH